MSQKITAVSSKISPFEGLQVIWELELKRFEDSVINVQFNGLINLVVNVIEQQKAEL